MKTRAFKNCVILLATSVVLIGYGFIEEAGIVPEEMISLNYLFLIPVVLGSITALLLVGTLKERILMISIVPLLFGWAYWWLYTRHSPDSESAGYLAITVLVLLIGAVIGTLVLEGLRIWAVSRKVS
jgi:hypothetical protein